MRVQRQRLCGGGRIGAGVKIIIEHGTQYDLRSFVPALVRTAALETMDHIDPGATVVKAEQALERDWVHGEPRQALVRYPGQ